MSSWRSAHRWRSSSHGSTRGDPWSSRRAVCGWPGPRKRPSAPPMSPMSPTERCGASYFRWGWWTTRSARSMPRGRPCDLSGVGKIGLWMRRRPRALGQLAGTLCGDSLDDAAHPIPPGHLGSAEDPVHFGNVGPEGPWGGRVVTNVGRPAHEVTQIGAVLLGAHRLAAGPVHHHGFETGDLEGPDTQSDVVVLVDGVVIVGRVRMEHDLLPLEDPTEPVDRGAALRSIGGKDPDDREWHTAVDRGKAGHRLPGDLREAVVAQVDSGGVVLPEWTGTLIGVGRTGRAVDKTSDSGARSDEATRCLGVHLETALPVGARFGPDERCGVKHMRQAIGQPGRIERRHVAHQGHDACPGQTLEIAGSTTSGQPEDLMALGQGSGDGKSDTPRRAGDQYLPPFGWRFDFFACHEG